MSAGRRLETLGHVAFAVMCVAIAAAAVQYVVSARTPAAPTPKPAIPAGTKLTLPAASTNEGQSASLLLVLSAQCRFCTESMPFYRALSALPVVTSGRVHLSVVSLQPLEPMRAYLDEHRLAAASIMTVSESGVYVRGTPTIVLTSRDGVVVNTWSGLLPEYEEKNVVKAVNNLVQGDVR